MTTSTAFARQLPLFFAVVFLLAGCNLFSSLHKDGRETNASVLVADGRAALSRGDYSNATTYFERAIQNDPRSSEARMGFAEAYLKTKGYNFGNLLNTLMAKDTTAENFIQPETWGCRDLAELQAMFSTLVAVLDPIACGQTTGPLASTDVNVNISVGFFYILRAAAQIQQVSTTYELVQMEKSGTSAASLGISQAEFDLLPDTFFWLANTPPLALLTQLQSDMDSGVARMRVAVAHSAYPDELGEIVDQFASLEIQTQWP